MASTVTIKLPSDPTKTISIEPMNVGQVNQLMSPKYQGAKGLDLLKDRIIPTCAGLEPGEYGEMLVGDGAGILLGLRRATFGEELDYSIMCNRCGKKGAYWVDLSQLEVQYLTPDPATGEIVTSGFTFEYVLKGVTHTYTFHLPTVNEQEESQKEQESLQAQADEEIDLTLVCGVKMSIDSVSGVTEGLEGPLKDQALIQHIFNAPMDFLHAFRDAMEEVNCGFESAIEQTCLKCGNEFASELPLLESFFSSEDRKLRKARRKRQVPVEGGIQFGKLLGFS